jgi:hypothetical protein
MGFWRMTRDVAGEAVLEFFAPIVQLISQRSGSMVSTDTGIRITTNSGTKVTLFEDRLEVEIKNAPPMKFCTRTHRLDASTVMQLLLLEEMSDINRTLDAMQDDLKALERKA